MNRHSCDCLCNGLNILSYVLRTSLTSHVLLGAAPRYLLPRPFGLPIKEVCPAVIQVCGCRHCAAKLVLATAEVFLAHRPSLLPVRKSSLAVVGILTADTLMIATPGLLIMRPTFLPVRETSCAIVLLWLRLVTAFFRVIATPSLLALGPALLPIREACVAVIW